MGVLFVGGLLIGIFLGRFFKVLVLVPAGCLAIFLICIRSVELGDNFFTIVAEVIILMTSLQTGYVLSALTRGSPEETANEVYSGKTIKVRTGQPRLSSARMVSEGRKSWVETASDALRSVYLR